MSEGDEQFIVYPGEAEMFIQSMEAVEYEDFGLKKWFSYHGYLNKLNMQAAASARTKSDEFVKEFLVTYQKIPVLVYDLIMVELWKKNAFKILFNSKEEPSSAFPLYTIMYHELLLANLLETITYHNDVVESFGDSVTDLGDWCYRALCHLVTQSASEENKTMYFELKNKVSETSNLEDLNRQYKVIEYEKGIKAITIVRHLLESCLNSDTGLPYSIGRRLLYKHDIPLVLCQLLEQTPWIIIGFNGSNKKRCRYIWHENGLWIPDDKSSCIIHKPEAQIWLCLFQILLANSSSLKYDFSVNHRRTALLKLRPLLTEIKLDILPVLTELRRFLEHLSFNESYGRTDDKINMCLIEVMPEIHKSIVSKYKNKWKNLSMLFKEQTESHRGKEAARKAAIQWTETFSEEHLSQLFSSKLGDSCDDDPLYPVPRCPTCGEVASKRCSRCRQEWYCGRECQVKHWPRHKKACDLLTEAVSTNKSVN
ncbi:Zinc finger MYND domain-containing protein 10 [Schistosoma japonicum]|nr:Zinc finger MYND domain-containing protein 10 [Schistosoma japonicum]